MENNFGAITPFSGALLALTSMEVGDVKTRNQALRVTRPRVAALRNAQQIPLLARIALGWAALLLGGCPVFGARAGTLGSWGIQALPLVQPGTRYSGVGAGWLHSLAIKTDGTVLAWGLDDVAECRPPAGMTGVVAVTGGYAHSLALKPDGTVAAWGGE